MKREHTLKVNGENRRVECEPEKLLIDLLREDLRLTGTKRGCDIGVCGTCTVLVDGKAKRACKVKVGDLFRVPNSEHALSKVEGSRIPDILTIEGVAKDGELHPVQQAFVDCGAIQCGFCTPGMVMQAIALIGENPSPTLEDVKRAFAGNLCRCTGYKQIFDAVLAAAERMRR